MEALCAEAPVLPGAPDVAAAPDVPAPILLYTLPPAPPLPALDEATAGTSGDDDIDSEQARIGKALHRLLQWGAADGGAFSSAQVQAAVREFSLTQAQGRHACDMAQRILAGQGAWAWHDAGLAWQADEVPVIWQGKALRLDRLVRRSSGEWWVLDYKSAARPLQKEGLVAQLQSYRAAVQAIHPGEVVKAAFLTGQGELVLIE